MDHAWVDEDTIVTVTDLSEFFIYRCNEIIKYEEFAMGEASDSLVVNASITAISTFSRGFILGNDEGMIALWEKTDVTEVD
mmetsp:Transcript_11644/g.1732  ORF Transcript_11644/g.1732 Transcript_11644/m.1732 type:complete len:81 (+) Transcript_11644:605-847(+)|eukprot:CAMPEP_0168313254 /NCGR_PEP_ID=MMETSP0210-20121227/655_1 /TAXON_ID=40633 /ORGANISM="Condylostoma magnum, Strain COL2" /LENGTH=80 /DNA_ID=CAMNT_0008267423 /DNA_START=483 /DNA_END=725 /DNA_ORIENTATION=+